MQRRSFNLSCTSLFGLALAGGSSLVHAQTWPRKPVKLILSQPAGSGADSMARVITDVVAREWGQAIVVDNHPGGQNVIGAVAAARAPADGYTFYFATAAALVTNKFLFASLPYDPLKDFTPVGMIGRVPFAVLVNANSKHRTIGDLLAAAKAEPGKVSLANEGPKTFGGIIARLLVAESRANFNLVSYVSIGTAAQDTMGGHDDAVVADLASTAQLIRQGMLRPLAVTSPQRLADWPQVPALAETLPGFDMMGWVAIVAPTGTPAEAVDRFNRDLDAALQRKDVADRIKAMGPVVSRAGTPAEMGQFLAAEDRRWQALSKEIGLLPE